MPSAFPHACRGPSGGIVCGPHLQGQGSSAAEVVRRSSGPAYKAPEPGCLPHLQIRELQVQPPSERCRFPMQRWQRQ